MQNRIRDQSEILSGYLPGYDGGDDSKSGS